MVKSFLKNVVLINIVMIKRFADGKVEIEPEVKENVYANTC